MSTRTHMILQTIALLLLSGAMLGGSYLAARASCGVWDGPMAGLGIWYAWLSLALFAGGMFAIVVAAILGAIVWSEEGLL